MSAYSSKMSDLNSWAFFICIILFFCYKQTFPDHFHESIHQKYQSKLIMEFYQQVQNRTGQTVAVINQVIPSLTVGTTSSAGLLAQSIGLDGLAQTRDD